MRIFKNIIGIFRNYWHHFNGVPIPYQKGGACITILGASRYIGLEGIVLYDNFRPHFRYLLEAFCYPIFFILKGAIFIAYELYFVFGCFKKLFLHDVAPIESLK